MTRIRVKRVVLSLNKIARKITDAIYPGRIYASLLGKLILVPPYIHPKGYGEVGAEQLAPAKVGGT